MTKTARFARHALGAESDFGLRERCDHPELIMLNVPSGAVDWANAVLNCIAAYVDDSGAELQPGEIFLEQGMTVEGAFTFAELDEEAAASIRFEGVDAPFLVVIPMP